MRRRVIKIGLAVLVALTLALLFALPARLLLGQRHSLAQTQSRLDVLTQENGQLRQELANLHDKAYVEQLAREEYGLVLPGQQAYVVLPAGSAASTGSTTTTTTTVP